jgi:hypothetical protein
MDETKLVRILTCLCRLVDIEHYKTSWRFQVLQRNPLQSVCVRESGDTLLLRAEQNRTEQNRTQSV